MKNLLRKLLFGDMRPVILAILIPLTGALVAAVRITQEDIDKAIQQVKRRVGKESAELLTAPAMTDEEMDALEEDPEEDDMKR